MRSAPAWRDDIARASDGWLMARSLRDPAVQTLLDAARPGWRWEPTLLEVQDGRPRIFTGVAMRARMALGLGPRRAWRVLEVVYRIEPPTSTFTSGRRTFLRRGAAAAGLLFVKPKSVQPPSVLSNQTSQTNPDWRLHLRIRASRELQGQELDNAKQVFKESSAWQHIRRIQKLAAEPQQYNAVFHSLEDGNSLTAIAAQIGELVAFYYVLTQPVAGVTRSLYLYRVNESKRTLQLVIASIDNSPQHLQSQEPGTNSVTCDIGFVPCPVCTDLPFDCVFRCCGSCTLTCVGGVFVCVACAFLWCPACGASCCRNWQSGCCPAGA